MGEREGLHCEFSLGTWLAPQSICSLFVYTFMGPFYMPVSFLGIEDSGKSGSPLLSQSSLQGRMEREREAATACLGLLVFPEGLLQASPSAGH